MIKSSCTSLLLLHYVVSSMLQLVLSMLYVETKGVEAKGVEPKDVEAKEVEAKR